MSLFFTSLNSGSNGNCYYIGNNNEAVLIDAGLSCKETEKRMRILELSFETVKAIFISHEHIDHIKGVEVLSKKYEIPVYISTKTYANSRTPIRKDLIRTLNSFSTIKIGGLSITGFPKNHDAADPVSFIVENDQYKVGVFTDIGTVCENVIKYFKKCHAAFLEANYDDKMLEEGPYPFHLKERIKSSHGHLSNKQAFDLFIDHRPDFMSHLLLSHLSKENNATELVYDLFRSVNCNTEIIIASRHEATPLFRFDEILQKKAASKNLMQLELFI